MYSELITLIQNYYKTKEFIPLHAPIFTGNEKKYLNDCIDSTFVSSVGAYVNKFEEMMAQYTGAKYAIATMNGTAALHVALVALGIGKDDEVLTQSLSFVATANAISYTAATPIFLDSSKETLSLCPDSLENFLKENTYLDKHGSCINKRTKKRIRACVPMHTFGLPAAIKQIITICEQYNIAVIEDAAESLGSRIDGTHTGCLGKMGIFSFNGNKVITAGGGGVVITDDEKLAKLLKHLTTTAKLAHAWNFEHDMIGYNYRMPNLNAALACAQLEQLDSFLTTKYKLFQLYKSFFEKAEGIKHYTAAEGTTTNYWLNAISFETPSEQQEFLKEMNHQGVMTRPLWTPMHQLEMFKHCEASTMENTDYLFKRVVNIPSGVAL